MKSRVCIVDYGSGNLFSVIRACNLCGIEPKIIRHGVDLDEFTHVVLPGVGAYDTAMKTICERDLDTAIIEYAKGGGKILGICLGMQLLLQGSEEHGWTEGLSLIKGKSIRFNENIDGQKVFVPQIQWNIIDVECSMRNNSESIVSGLPSLSYMYFVHSFYACGVPEAYVTAKT